MPLEMSGVAFFRLFKPPKMMPKKQEVTKKGWEWQQHWHPSILDLWHRKTQRLQCPPSSIHVWTTGKCADVAWGHWFFLGSEQMATQQGGLFVPAVFCRCHPKTKRLEPQNGGLEAVFPFLVGDFQVKDVEFRGSGNILKKVLEGLAAFLFLEWRRNSCCHGEPFSSKRINFQPFCGAGKMCPFDKSKQLNNKMPPKARIFGCHAYILSYSLRQHMVQNWLTYQFWVMYISFIQTKSSPKFTDGLQTRFSNAVFPQES